MEIYPSDLGGVQKLSIYQSINQELSSMLIASKQDMMREYQTSKQMVPVLLKKQCSEIEKVIAIANTLMARDYKGFGNQAMNGVIERLKDEQNNR